jgi:hypothetical protein
MLVGFARLESQRIGLRVAAQREQTASRGLPCPGGWRPFGYREGGLEVDEGEAAVIREATSRVLAGETRKDPTPMCTIPGCSRNRSQPGTRIAAGRRDREEELSAIMRSRRLSCRRKDRLPDRA